MAAKAHGWQRWASLLVPTDQDVINRNPQRTSGSLWGFVISWGGRGCCSEQKTLVFVLDLHLAFPPRLSLPFLALESLEEMSVYKSLIIYIMISDT